MVTITLKINSKQDADFLLMIVRHCVKCRDFDYITSMDSVRKMLDLHDRLKEAIDNAK